MSNIDSIKRKIQDVVKDLDDLNIELNNKNTNVNLPMIFEKVAAENNYRNQSSAEDGAGYWIFGPTEDNSRLGIDQFGDSDYRLGVTQYGRSVTAHLEEYDQGTIFEEATTEEGLVKLILFLLEKCDVNRKEWRKEKEAYVELKDQLDRQTLQLNQLKREKENVKESTMFC